MKLRMLACLMITALAAAMPAEGKTVWPARGGTGDAYRVVECPKGQYLVGFQGRVGAWVDKLGILCASYLDEGRRGRINYKLTMYGGEGGAPTEASCPRGGFIFALDIAVIDATKYVSTVSATCFDGYKKKSTPGAMVFTGTGRGFRYQQSCPRGEMGTGVSIRYGRHVNSLGLVCDKLR
jgi:hypothetical protein